MSEITTAKKTKDPEPLIPLKLWIARYLIERYLPDYRIILKPNRKEVEEYPVRRSVIGRAGRGVE